MQATFRIETGNGKSQLWINKNNAGGIKCGKSYCTYKNQEAGIEDLRNVLIPYYEKYGSDLKSIRLKYCGLHCGDEDLQEFTKIYKEEVKGQSPKGE